MLNKLNVYLFLVFFCVVSAQGQIVARQISYRTPIYEMNVGDTLRNIQFKAAVNYSKGSMNLSDFKGRNVILDFWAPWCSPCIAAFPKLDSIQKKYNEKLQILLVTRESMKSVNKIYGSYESSRKVNFSLPSIVEDSILSFIPAIIPHYVWLDKNGVIKAVTGGEELTNRNIETFLSGERLNLANKDDEKILRKTEYGPIFSQSQLWTAKDLVFHSVLTKFNQGYSTNVSRDTSWGWIRCTRHPIILLYKMAFGKFDMSFINNNRVVLEGFKNEEDSFLIGRFTPQNMARWNDIQQNQYYNYELVVPVDKQKDNLETRHGKLFSMMQDDINRYFKHLGIKGQLEKRKVKSLVLVRISEIDKVASNATEKSEEVTQFYVSLRKRHMSDFVAKLQSFYSSENAMPIFDETKYVGEIDIEINADLRDRDAVNKELWKYDLKLIPKETEADMIIIRKEKN
ncbi:TlpA disulfide reductase family protein [Paraflavitalea sp. CAU 1676]|uniref:TlpA family protein disulfide reductase n=1 Tax=Paraflavitalea sp. CAU 1676 TaxID=3032598 RepID=UPI0023DB0CBA|nr:TlpA disulfide reductase family protein [Paraflavitalea sp. CAU 1676]MDF2191230.1 TlpA disulfide reductase family protein [Paraflavitalea sp. CAU 1676]